MTLTKHHRDRHNVGRWVMWGLIAFFAVISLAVVLRLDPGIIGPAAGIFILGCLLLCGVMAGLDARQTRTTETVIRALRVKTGDGWHYTQREGSEMTTPSPLSTPVTQDTGSSYGRGEIRVGRLFGIPLRLHWSFLLFVGWLVFDGMHYGPAGILDAIGWTSMLFGSVLIHELAHALVGRSRGATVQDIILLPIGGATRLTKLIDGRGNLAMTAAGPLTSLALAATAGLAAFVTRAALFPVDIHHGTVIGRLFWLNVMLGLFNLLPLFPMDGGRILQGLLSPRVGDRRSTIIAATVGRVLAAGLVILGLTGNLWLVVIGFYLFVVAGREAAMASSSSVAPLSPTAPKPSNIEQRGGP